MTHSPQKHNDYENCRYDILDIENLEEDNEEDDIITIVYNGEKIETKKSLLLAKCRYFRKHLEIFHQKEMNLSDKYPHEIFRNFIFSMKTQKIEMKENSFFEYFELSSRYEYHELYFSLQKYLNSLPFLSSIISDLISIDTLSNSNEIEKENGNDDETAKKEEMIAKHLDDCIKSGLLRKMKYSRLYRVFSSKSLCVRNYHLLFDFILSLFDDFERNHKENGINSEKEKEKSILQSFTTLLNYEEMNEEEIGKLFSHPLFCDFYQPKLSTSLISKLLEQQRSNNIVLSEQERRLEELEHKFELMNGQITNQIKSEFSQQNCKIQQIEKQYEKHEEQINSQQTLFSNDLKEIMEKLSILEQSFSNHKTEVKNEIEENYKQIKSIDIDSLRQEINGIKQGLKLLTIESKYENKPFEGIISELTKLTEGNVYESKIVDITGNREGGLFSSLLDYNFTGICYCSFEEDNSYLCFDFQNHRISLSNYSLKTSTWHATCADHLRSWKIEGSNDGTKWEELDSHSNDQTFTSPCQIHTFEINNKNLQKSRFRFIRLTQTGPSSSGKKCFDLTNIEFFGTYFFNKFC
ncbi:hypothetical protein TRFO_41435 [Tritrichomonas foetus]|uniref:BTB domain-containing protein n=1 Tax=Tritrichomonas foetus TaxID=1144522 RepID=A0A1J4L0D9_9EUKA|nr:hypothetical protein TRFO_41435 [Tritrichomonas foetus]|eukprot:OHT16967.1 hypothetical protein TRFO_41435 [Tritrichomonas foetus]